MSFCYLQCRLLCSENRAAGGCGSKVELAEGETGSWRKTEKEKGYGSRAEGAEDYHSHIEVLGSDGVGDRTDEFAVDPVGSGSRSEANGSY